MKDSVSKKYSKRKEEDLDQQAKFEKEYKERLEKQNARLDEKAIKSTVEAIVDHINRNMNKR